MEYWMQSREGHRCFQTKHWIAQRWFVGKVFEISYRKEIMQWKKNFRLHISQSKNSLLKLYFSASMIIQKKQCLAVCKPAPKEKCKIGFPEGSSDSWRTLFLQPLFASSLYFHFIRCIDSIVKKHFHFHRMPGSNIDPIYKAEQSKVGRDSTAWGTVCFKWQLLIMLSYQPPPTLKGRKTESKTKEQQVYQEGRVKPAFLSSLGAWLHLR